MGLDSSGLRLSGRWGFGAGFWGCLYQNVRGRSLRHGIAYRVRVSICGWGCKGRITEGHSRCLADCLFAIFTIAAERAELEGRKSRLVYSVGF